MKRTTLRRKWMDDFALPGTRKTKRKRPMSMKRIDEITTAMELPKVYDPGFGSKDH